MEAVVSGGGDVLRRAGRMGRRRRGLGVLSSLIGLRALLVQCGVVHHLEPPLPGPLKGIERVFVFWGRLAAVLSDSLGIGGGVGLFLFALSGFFSFFFGDGGSLFAHYFAPTGGLLFSGFFRRWAFGFLLLWRGLLGS